MGNSARSLIYCVLAWTLISCSGIPVSQDYSTSTDFSALKTYRWNAELLTKEKAIEGNNPLLNKRIHTAIDKKLAMMGYKLAPEPDFDFVVSYQMKTQTRLSSDGTTGFFSFGFGNIGRFGAIGVSTGHDIHEQDEAALMIDIADSKTNELIWRGVSTRDVYIHNDPDELTDTINQHIDAILSQFPPGKKQ